MPTRLPRTSFSSQDLAAELAAFATQQLQAQADPSKAVSMAAYMKTDMPFYGVAKPERELIVQAVKDRFPITTRRKYEQIVNRLWRLPHREEKYLAIHLARLYPDFVTPKSLPLYKQLIQEGAWWDFVDEIAIQLVGKVLHTYRAETCPIMDAWINDDDMWVRRSALLSQIRHKHDTDTQRLFRYCRERAHESEFFIRKAIGWALRDYSYFGPDQVATFLADNKNQLNRLSFREGEKVLRRKGYLL